MSKTLDELRAEIAAVKEEGRKIISHFKKMQEYYSDWEDRLNKIELEISQAEKELGLTKEVIESPREEFADFLNEN